MTETGRIRVGVSTCLLGEKVRWDAGHQHDPYLTGTLGRHLELVPVCPEAELGLGIPREPIHLEGDPAALQGSLADHLQFPRHRRRL